MNRLISTIVSVCLVFHSAVSFAREWSDATGQFKIQAEFVEFKGGKVTLKQTDGSLVAIELNKLSKADQEFVKEKVGPAPAANPFGASDSPATPFGASEPVKIVKLDERPNTRGKFGEVRRFGEQGWGVASLAFSPSGGVLAVGSKDGKLQLYDVNEEAKLDFLDDRKSHGEISACLFTPAGDRLIVGGDKGVVRVFDASNPRRLQEVSQFAGHTKTVTSVAVSADGKLAISGSKDETARLWNVDDGSELISFDGFEHDVKACFVSQDGKTAYATDGELLLAIDVPRQVVAGRAKLTRSAVSCYCAAFSPDGKWVIAADSYSLRLWDLKTGKEQKALQSDEIQWSCGFTPDGTRVLSGAAGRLNIWDVKKQTRIASLITAGEYYVQTLAASPDNLHASATPGSAGQVLQVFRLPEVAR